MTGSYPFTETQIVMMKLENLEPGISLVGIEPTLIATLIAVVPIGEGAVQVIYKTPEGLWTPTAGSRATRHGFF